MEFFNHIFTVGCFCFLLYPSVRLFCYLTFSFFLFSGVICIEVNLSTDGSIERCLVETIKSISRPISDPVESQFADQLNQKIANELRMGLFSIDRDDFALAMTDDRQTLMAFVVFHSDEQLERLVKCLSSWETALLRTLRILLNNNNMRQTLCCRQIKQGNIDSYRGQLKTLAG